MQAIVICTARLIALSANADLLALLHLLGHPRERLLDLLGIAARRTCRTGNPPSMGAPPCVVEPAR